MHAFANANAGQRPAGKLETRPAASPADDIGPPLLTPQRRSNEESVNGKGEPITLSDVSYNATGGSSIRPSPTSSITVIAGRKGKPKLGVGNFSQWRSRKNFTLKLEFNESWSFTFPSVTATPDSPVDNRLVQRRLFSATPKNKEVAPKSRVKRWNDYQKNLAAKRVKPGQRFVNFEKNISHFFN